MDSYDEARISQWAAHSATSSSAFPVHVGREQDCLGYGSGMMSASVTPQNPDVFPISQDDAFPAFFPSPSDAVFVPGMSFNTSDTLNAGADFARLEMDQEVTSGPVFGFPQTLGGDIQNNGLSSTINDQAFPAFANGNLSDFGLVETHPSMILGDEAEFALSSGWISSRTDTSQPLDWPTASGLTPSSSSMQSSNSFMGQLPDTPASAMMYNGTLTASHNGPLEIENGFIPPFTLGEAAVSHLATGHNDPERFAIA